MNRHTKTALYVAPILILGGYILSDMYLENKAHVAKVIELTTEGQCDVINQHCVLKSGEFEVNVTHDNGITTFNSTYPLDTATLFLVDANNESSFYQLGMKDTPYYWKRETPLGQLVANSGEQYKLRLIAEIKGGKYIAEFTTKTK
ncbi:hypothetical protein ACOYR1_00585 [Thalassotalea piscium]